MICVTCAVVIAVATCTIRVCAAGDDSSAVSVGAGSSPSADPGITSHAAEIRDPTALASPPASASDAPDPDAVPSTTVEIAPAVITPQAAQEPPSASARGGDSSSFADSPEIRDYEQHQDDTPPPGATGAMPMQAYLSSDAITSPIGLELREARRTLKSGAEADGLLVIGVISGSPAAAAGLHAYSRGIHNALTGAMIVAGLIFPPAILGVPLLDYTQIGESYDMIIGVDGARVTNFLDFEDQMRDLRPGEIVYLSVVRDGRRLQFRVDVPVGATLATY